MQDLTGARHGYLHLGTGGESARSGDASRVTDGQDFFGHLFRCNPPNLTDEQLQEIASKMAWEDQPTDPSSDSRIPAGYTILGQFITHDLTFDTTPLGGPPARRSKLGSRRTPQLDLDSVYEKSPRLTIAPPHEVDQPDRLLYRSGLGKTDDVPRQGDLAQTGDVALYRAEQAIIGDVRNDDNVLLSQLHLAFLKLHNWFVGYVLRNQEEKLPGESVFDAARRLCTWHYQWIVVNDFLPRIVSQDVIDSIICPDPQGRPTTFDFRVYKEPNIKPPSIPVEFSAAAFRFGHSMVRSHYRLNQAGIEYPLFGATKGETRNLGGQRQLPAALEVDWTRFFFDPPPPEESEEQQGNDAPALSVQPSDSQSAEASPATKRALAALRRAEADAVEARTKAETARIRAERAEARAEAATAEAEKGTAQAETTEGAVEAVAADARAKAARAKARAGRARAQAEAAWDRVHGAEATGRAAEAGVRAAEARDRADAAEAIATAAEASIKATEAPSQATVSGYRASFAGASAVAERARFKADRARAVAERAATAQALAELEAFSRFQGIFARKIDSHLTQILATLPADILPPNDQMSTKSLALRDLERGKMLELSPGRQVAEKVKGRTEDIHKGEYRILTIKEMGLDEVRFPDDVPLWFYLLKEAEIVGKGENLGPTGGRIVAEVILGVLRCDGKSYFHVEKWKPVIRAEGKDGKLTMADLLRIADELEPDDD